MKNYIFIALLNLIFNTCYSQGTWEITYGDVNYFGQSDISFVNPNVGYAIGYTNTVVRLMKTTNKGLNWNLMHAEYADYNWSKNSSISFRKKTSVLYLSVIEL